MSSPLNEQSPEALARQALARPLTEREEQLANALEKIFSTGAEKLPTELARLLQEGGIRRPSGQTGDWTTAILEEELALINKSLDEAYSRTSKPGSRHD